MLTNFNDFETEEPSSVSNKTFLNQDIFNKRIGWMRLSEINFLNCNFDNVYFAEFAKEITFKNCKIKSTCFYKGKYEDFTFQDCKLINCTFRGAELRSFRCINCELEEIYFTGTEIFNCDFSKSKLYNVSFSQSLTKDLKIQDSSLEKIKVFGMRSLKMVNKEYYGEQEILYHIEDYDTFLEFFEVKPKASDGNDKEALIFTMLFFILIIILLFFITY